MGRLGNEEGQVEFYCLQKCGIVANQYLLPDEATKQEVA